MTTRVILSVFSAEDSNGNPAGVVLSPSPLSFAERCAIAVELGQPATAFISHPTLESLTSPRPQLAWHTSIGEPIPLCGHATAAGVHYLLNRVNSDHVEFDYFFEETDGAQWTTGTIVGVREGNRFGVDLPSGLPWRELAKDEVDTVGQSWCTASDLERGDIVKMVALDSGFSEPGVNEYLTIQLSPSVDLGRVKIDFDVLKTMPYRGIWITSRWSPDHPDHVGVSPSSAIRSRTFFPKTGLDEDEVCGSAHTFLVPWWTTTYPREFEEFKAKEGYCVPAVQLSPARGRLEVNWNGKTRAEGGRCMLYGEGKIVQE